MTTHHVIMCLCSLLVVLVTPWAECIDVAAQSHPAVTVSRSLHAQQRLSEDVMDTSVSILTTASGPVLHQRLLQTAPPESSCQRHAGPGGACGATAAYACCTAGQCCSAFGYCGTAELYCSISNGCQVEYGSCTPPPCPANTMPNSSSLPCPAPQCHQYTTRLGGRCGPTAGCCRSNMCCSRKGRCGRTAGHCKAAKGCQALFGRCT